MQAHPNQLDILIIEDNDSDFFLIEDMLRSSRVNIREIYQATRISEAQALLQTHAIGLVLLDLSLPDSFGIASFLHIKPLVQHIPVIILTGNAESSISLEILQQGAQDYLVKGEFKTELLTRAILYSIERKNAEEKKRCLEKELEDQRKEKQQQITQAILEAQEEERRSIGAELHDNINQILATANLYLTTALREKADTAGMIKKSRVCINSGIEEIRKLSKRLVTPVFISTDLKQAIEDLTNDIRDLKKIDIRTELDELDNTPLHDALKLNLYRIIQEQLNNILKYANASEIWVRVNIGSDNVTLLISDNGKGFDTGTQSKGIGMINIQNRAELFNGKVEVNSAPGKGCSLKVIVTRKAA
jgi:signal transduction histidine kinase